MAAIRKKRNFKGLHLADSPLSTPSPTSGNTASSSSSVSYSKSTGTSSTGANGSSTAKSSSQIATTALPGTDSASSGANYHNKLSEQLASLELGEYKLDLKNDDLTFMSELGSGNGGTVTKVLHEKSKTIMAKKVVFIDAKPTVRKQILRELQILHECNSPYIVSFYGAYLAEPHINMCMEYMDCGSLDSICKRNGPIRPEVCGKIVVTVVHGLTYLYEVHRIIHRGERPERIQGDQYSVKSDVWSLGITVIEVALGRFPFSDDASSDEEDDLDDGDLPDELKGTLSPSSKPDLQAAARAAKERARKDRKKPKTASPGMTGNGSQMSILDLLQHIVNEPAPKLPPRRCKI
ncbi:hypothetical protein MRB53_040654 [Persea americana]|nr:hypothetical protein MRB53_040654 [Persea americana]